MTSATRQRRVPPMILRRLALWVVWLGAAGAAAWLYFGPASNGSVRAVAEVVEYRIAPLEPERVSAVMVETGATVRQGDVVALLDGARVSQELSVVAAELSLAEATLRGQAAALGRERLAEERSFANAADQAEVALLQARVLAEEDRAQLSAVQAQVRRWQDLVDKRMAATETLDQLKAEARVLERRVALHPRTIDTLEARFNDARQRWQKYQTAVDGAPGDAPAVPGEADAAAELAPLRNAVAVARASLEQLEERRRALTLVAPADGVVQRVLLQPGDVAAPDVPVLIMRPTGARRVFAYPDDALVRELVVGGKALVVPRDGTAERLPATVVSLGAGVAPYPEALQTTPNVVLWGREVVLQLDGPASLAPGQVLGVVFEPHDSGRGDVAAAAERPSAAAPEATAGMSRPQPLVVPSALRARSRFEPSGLAWMPALRRYLVVSDDTGLPDADDHAPWLFALDAGLRFDDAPRVLRGLDKVNDLEAIAVSREGTAYLLSSQSASRRGRRPASRTWLLRVSTSAEALEVTGKASLAAALAALNSEAAWSALGLGPRDPSMVRAGAGGFDRLLNIEGLTFDAAGALLLGLKEPLTPQGEALVWRLEEPDAFIDRGTLPPDALRLHAKFPLTAGPHGHERRAGIADLLQLPDGRLLIAASALATGERGPDAGQRADDGALFLATPPSGTAPGWRVERVADFPGLRPEAVALGPEPGSLLVLFDRGSELPFYARLPLAQ